MRKAVLALIFGIVTVSGPVYSQDMLAEYTARNNAALHDLVTTHKVQLRAFPDDVLKKLRTLSDEVVGELAKKDKSAQQVFDSFRKFRDQVRHTVDEVTQIGGKLTEIIDQVEVVTERFDAVNEGMSSQGEGVEQINEAMTSLSEHVHKTAESLSEFTSAADEMRGAVTALREELGKFKLGD